MFLEALSSEAPGTERVVVAEAKQLPSQEDASSNRKHVEEPTAFSSFSSTLDSPTASFSSSLSSPTSTSASSVASSSTASSSSSTASSSSSSTASSSSSSSTATSSSSTASASSSAASFSSSTIASSSSSYTAASSSSSSSSSSAASSSSSLSSPASPSSSTSSALEVKQESKQMARKATRSVGGKEPDPPVEDPYYNEDFGVGMSGGGIRSAAFCSGVLWALMNQSMLPPQRQFKESAIVLPRGKIPKFFSCVSGGGYIGSSFLWWARCMGGGDPRAWQDEYFARMRKKVGYFVDCSNPLKAIVGVVRILFFLIFLLFAGVASFLPSTYILSETILLSYDGYYQILKDHFVPINATLPDDNEQLDGEVLLATDIAWLIFLFLIMLAPVMKVVTLILREASVASLQSIFLKETTTWPRSLKIFVGGLFEETGKQDLKEHFENFGVVTECVLMADRGFAFVTFQEASAIDAVFAEIAHVIKGKLVVVRQTTTRPRSLKIFVDGLPPEASREDLKAHFGKYGPIRDYAVMANRGFGVVTFEDGASVDAVLAEHDIIIKGVSVTCQEAVPRAVPPKIWAKLVREMFANIYWYGSTIFTTFAFVVLCDFSLLTKEDAHDYNSAVADCLRVVVLAILFYRSPDRFVNFLQAQILIWTFKPPDHFFGAVDDSFKRNYKYFAIICKVLLPLVSVIALFRERLVFEFIRNRLVQTFYDCPSQVSKDSISFQGLLCGPEYGSTSIRKLFWNSGEKDKFYPVYISGTTVDKWMVTPISNELFPLEDLMRELEAKFYFANMPAEQRPRIERILRNGAEKAGQMQDQNAWEMTLDDPAAPLFFKQRSAEEKADILTFTTQAFTAHADASNKDELMMRDLLERFGYDAQKSRDLLSWAKNIRRRRRQSLPQTDAVKRFIGQGNVAYIDRAVAIARSSMMSDAKLRDSALQFEAGKGELTRALRRSLTELTWRNITPKSAARDVLALTSEGWWERYGVGLDQPIFVLPPATTTAQQKTNNKVDAISGANPDLTIGEAMVMSGAVGRSDTSQQFMQSQVLLGLRTGRWVNTTTLSWPVQFLTMFVIELLLCLPILIWGGLDDPYSRGGLGGSYLGYAGGTSVCILYGIWAFLLPLMKRSKLYPFLPHTRLTSTLSEEDSWDHGIPSMVYLADGGHVENLGLLPLLARRLKYIVLACAADEKCLSLKSALDQARAKLGVSFRELRSDQLRRHVKRVSVKELDLTSDIEFFARDESQRILVFEILYPRAIRSWKKSAGSFAPATLEEPPQETGYIFFLQALEEHAQGFKEGEEAGPTDTPLGAPCLQRLDKKHEPLSGCCCNCCHRFPSLSSLSGSFPNHVNIFQFFTPTLFDAYHAQGVRAMRDALEISLDASHEASKRRKK